MCILGILSFYIVEFSYNSIFGSSIVFSNIRIHSYIFLLIFGSRSDSRLHSHSLMKPRRQEPFKVYTLDLSIFSFFSLSLSLMCEHGLLACKGSDLERAQ